MARTFSKVDLCCHVHLGKARSLSSCLPWCEYTFSACDSLACAGGGRCLSAFLSGAGHHPRFPQEACQGEPHLTPSGGNAGSAVIGIHFLATALRFLVHLLLRRQESLARLSASLWLTNHASSMRKSKRLQCCAFLCVRSWAMR
jgi:hypothetical protein